MAKEKMPGFIIYQSSPKEFHICFRVGDRWLRWCSYYPPATDVRYPREVMRIADIAATKLPSKPVFDEGSYTVTKSDSKTEAEQKMAAGAEKSSFGFILNGKKLKGRFLLKNNGKRTVLQKYKDKYATEEDVLSGDLARTIHTLLPAYDEKKIQLPQRKKSNKLPALKKQKAAKPQPVPREKKSTPKQEKPVPKDKPAPAVTADKKIGSITWHFTFYTSDTGDVLCLAAHSRSGTIVLQLKGKQWRLLPPAGKPVLKHEKAFASHAKALYDIAAGAGK